MVRNLLGLLLMGACLGLGNGAALGFGSAPDRDVEEAAAEGRENTGNTAQSAERSLGPIAETPPGEPGVRPGAETARDRGARGPRDSSPTGTAGTAAPTTTETEAPLSREMFLRQVHAINQSEIRLGELALNRGSHARVKEFGKMLAADHRQADRKLTEIARRDNISLAAVAGNASLCRLQEEQERTYRQLQTLSGARFDEQFAREMVRGHASAIELVNRAMAQIDEASARNLAEDLLPVLRKHEEAAQALVASGLAE